MSGPPPFPAERQCKEAHRICQPELFQFYSPERNLAATIRNSRSFHACGFTLSKPMFIDAHAHLDKYGDALEAALEQIRNHQVFTVAVAMDIPSYQRCVEIGEVCELVLPTFGVHPRRAPAYAQRLRDLDPLIEQSPAIGEIGLDYHWVKDSSQFPAQRKVFERFLAAAREQNKLVNLHTKGAEKEILEMLERFDISRAIVHWYSGPLSLVRPYTELGAYFTIGVELLYSEAIRAIATAIPDHLLLTETDNPGGLKWLKGVAGMPVDLKSVIQELAELRGLSTDALARNVHENFLRLVDNDPWLEQARAVLCRWPTA
jgi:TatD DNase family protein